VEVRLRRVATTGLAFLLGACGAFSGETRAADPDAAAETDARADGVAPASDAGDAGPTSFCSGHPQAVFCDDFTTFDAVAWTQQGNGLKLDDFRYVSPPRSLAVTTTTPPGGGGAQARRDVAAGAKLVRCAFSLAVGDLADISLFDVAALVLRSAGSQRHSVRVRLSGNPKRVRLMTITDGDTSGTTSVADLPAPAAGEWMRLELELDPSTTLATLTSNGASASVLQPQIALADAAEIALGRYAISGQESVTAVAWYDDVVCTAE
jgi:hypothetical protein